MRCAQCEKCVENVTTVGLCGNFGLAIVKALGGIFGNSAALIADAIHSIADVMIALMIHISVKISNRPPDDKYPFGYGHVEFITSGVVGISLLMVSFTICWTSIRSIIEGEITEPAMIALLVLLVSISANEVLYRYCMCVGIQADSLAIISAAKEDRSDSLTSIAALIGVVGAKLGAYILDPIAAIFVGLVITHSGYEVISEAVKGMMDTDVEPREKERIIETVLGIKGVREVSGFKAHKSGQKFILNLKVGVDFRTGIKKAKKITDEVKKSVMSAEKNIANIKVKLLPVKTAVRRAV